MKEAGVKTKTSMKRREGRGRIAAVTLLSEGSLSSWRSKLPFIGTGRPRRKRCIWGKGKTLALHGTCLRDTVSDLLRRHIARYGFTEFADLSKSRSAD